MKIRLTVNVPVHPKHGCSKGAEFEVIHKDEGLRFVWILGAAGEKVKIWGPEGRDVECEVVEP